jgi:hypothetical protein
LQLLQQLRLEVLEDDIWNVANTYWNADLCPVAFWCLLRWGQHKSSVFYIWYFMKRIYFSLPQCIDLYTYIISCYGNQKLRNFWLP